MAGIFYMTDITKSTNHLHKVYCDVSGLPVSCPMGRVWQWEAWIAKGWTEADLRLVLNHLKSRTQAAPVWAKMNMMFGNLIGSLDRFEELLIEARALARIKRVDQGKAQVLRATNRPSEPPTSTAKSPEQIMRESEALKKLLAVRDSL